MTYKQWRKTITTACPK